MRCPLPDGGSVRRQVHETPQTEQNCREPTSGGELLGVPRSVATTISRPGGHRRWPAPAERRYARRDRSRYGRRPCRHHPISKISNIIRQRCSCESSIRRISNQWTQSLASRAGGVRSGSHRQEQLSTAERSRLLASARSLHLKRKISVLPRIVPTERSERMPMSFAQQRLWFLAQMEGVSEAYHIAFGLDLHGQLDGAALWCALDRIWRVTKHFAQPLRC